MRRMAEVVEEIERFEGQMRYYRLPFECIGPIAREHLPRLVIKIRYNAGGSMREVKRAITPQALERMAILTGQIVPGAYEAVQGTARALARGEAPLALLQSYCDALNLYLRVAQEQVKKEGKHLEYCILSVPSNQEGGNRIIVAFLSGAYSPIWLAPILRQLEQRMTERLIDPVVLEFAASYALTSVVLPIEQADMRNISAEGALCLQIVNGYDGNRSFAVFPSVYWNGADFAFESAVPKRVYHVYNAKARAEIIMSYMSPEVLRDVQRRWQIARTRIIRDKNEIVELLLRRQVRKKDVAEIQERIQAGMTVAHALLLCHRVLTQSVGSFQSSILTGGILYDLTGE